jgi:hypothetical protein
MGCVQICILVCLNGFHLISKSFVVSDRVSLSEVEYAERRAGHVIAKISFMQTHGVDPHCYLCITIRCSTSLASPYLRRDHFSRRSWRSLAKRRHLECHEAKYAIHCDITTLDWMSERDFSLLRRPFRIKMRPSDGA